MLRGNLNFISSLRNHLSDPENNGLDTDISCFRLFFHPSQSLGVLGLQMGIGSITNRTSYPGNHGFDTNTGCFYLRVAPLPIPTHGSAKGAFERQRECHHSYLRSTNYIYIGRFQLFFHVINFPSPPLRVLGGSCPARSFTACKTPLQGFRIMVDEIWKEYVERMES